MKLEQAKKAYQEILDIVNKHKDICLYSFNEMNSKAKIHLLGLELKEKYGLNINPEDVRSLDYNNFGKYRSIGWWGEKYRRTISWSNDGSQPEDELLLSLCFPTGAYIFGNSNDNDYPEELFKKFWQELKSYNPEYVDTVNKNLFFSIENASKIFNDFPGILEKYYEINKRDSKERKIKKLKEEIEKLSN